MKSGHRGQIPSNPDNDDAGAISSWYVFSALGLYPLISGVGGFVIGSPLFASATVNLENGQTLQINGVNAGDGNPYVQRLNVNGVASTSLWLAVSTILGEPTTTLDFTLGSSPNTSWGSGPGDAPPSFDVAGAPPTVVNPPTASPNPATGTTASLSVLGDDANGESSLIYSWIIDSQPTGAAAPTFSVNGTNAAKNTTVTFHAAGNYTFQVSLFDGSQITYATLGITVNQTASGLVISPENAIAAPGAQQNFTALEVDQFGNALATGPVTWSLVGSGSITQGGVYTAGAAPGNAQITATGNNQKVSTNVTIVPPVDVAATQAGVDHRLADGLERPRPKLRRRGLRASRKQRISVVGVPSACW